MDEDYLHRLIDRLEDRIRELETQAGDLERKVERLDEQVYDLRFPYDG